MNKASPPYIVFLSMTSSRERLPVPQVAARFLQVKKCAGEIYTSRLPYIGNARSDHALGQQGSSEQKTGKSGLAREEKKYSDAIYDFKKTNRR